MAETYLVSSGYGRGEWIEKKSRFIGQVWRVETEKEARARIDGVYQQFPEIGHHSFCYVLREGNILRYNDGGEPQGSAGQPAGWKDGFTHTINFCSFLCQNPKYSLIFPRQE